MLKAPRETRRDAQGRPRVLVVDDEQSMREVLEIVLSNKGFDLTTASDVAGALEFLEETTFDCVVTDLRMGNDRQAGLKLLEWIRDNAGGTPAIMMTAFGSVETAIEAMRLGASDYIMKPFKNDELLLRIRKSIDARDVRRENTALRREQARHGNLDNIVGVSDIVEDVREMIRRVAVLPSTVAIHGESGTGKELVARGIHQLSDRAGKPFVAINCGAFPENLLESELFGHKKGAFTGAVEDKEGLFVVANGGTLFLDEIGEMPLSLQVKLLRVLDNGRVLPVGGTTDVSVDVRIISATNRDLESMAREGDFREDLYYRLNVIPITVPPLRERGDDIPILVRHFIARHARKMGRPEPKVAREVMDRIQAFPWPGNVRELENAMERAVALCRGEALELDDLPRNIQQFAPADDLGQGAAMAAGQLPVNGINLEDYIAGLETSLIEQALKRAKYSQKRAAHLLGLTPRSLRYRLQKYNLDTQ